MSKKSVQYRQSNRRRRKLEDRAAMGATDPDELKQFMVRERADLYRPLKQQITLRLDKDVIAWFKGRGAKYQTRINEALREYIRSQMDKDSRS